jgi:hypothetical protein
MDSPMDEMVQLLWEARMRGPLFAAPGVRHIVYVDLEKIPLLLVAPRSVPYPMTKPKIQTPAQDHTNHHPAHDATSGPAHPTETDRQSNAPTQVSHTISVDLGLADSEAMEEIEEQISTDQLDVDATVASETAVHSMDSARADDPDDSVFAHSNDQIVAACAIQAMYRRHVLRRESVRKALSEARSRFFIDCWVESEKMEWPHRHYRLLFLGPLPHLLLCLERANTSAFDFKMKVKRRLTMAKHTELEDVQMKMTEAKWVPL